MLLSHSHKFAFIHIPKTGGSSVLGALYPYSAKKPKNPKEPNTHGWQPRYHYMGMHVPLDKCRHLIPEDYLIFSFVRNPWDRAASLFNIEKYRKKGQSFEDFLKHLPDTKIHGRLRKNQADWLKGRPMGFVGKMETMKKDFASLMEKIGLENIELPHFNRTPTRPHYSTLYNKRTKKLVRQIYKEDIERFGYCADF
jgi:hypothetical protein